MIKKIPRLPMRPDDELAQLEDPEIWQPKYKCFCCGDTGIVMPHLAVMAVDDYRYETDKLPRCLAPGCNADCYFDTDNLENCIDYRVNASTCQELDLIERESWRNTVKAQQQYIVDLKKIADEKKMSGCSDRTVNDNREAQQRKDEIDNISNEQWMQMANNYRGGDC